MNAKETKNSIKEALEAAIEQAEAFYYEDGTTKPKHVTMIEQAAVVALAKLYLETE